MLPIDLLEGFEIKMAAIQNRPACQVDIASLPEAYDGLISIFTRENQMIIFNEKLYNEASELKIMGALFHEIRHAYQYFVVTNNMTTNEDQLLINQWRNEFKEKSVLNYLSASIEIDALAYADLNIYNIYKVHLDIPEDLIELVKLRQVQIKDNLDIIKM